MSITATTRYEDWAALSYEEYAALVEVARAAQDPSLVLLESHPDADPRLISR